MSQRYVLTTVAQRHFIEIGDFVSQESIEAAEKVYDALEEAFERLADMPGIGHTREDLTDRPLKFWSVFSYLVVYEPGTEPLRIVAVIHGARDLGQVLKTV